MNLANIFNELRGTPDQVTEDDIRQAFGDYHNLLQWLAGFLISDEESRAAYIVDAVTIADSQTLGFHEWLVHWAARATIECALQEQHTIVAELASKYEKTEPDRSNQSPLSKQDFLFLVKNSDRLRTRLDPLCRFVLVLRGIAKDAYDQVAAQLGISRRAVERAYCIAFDTVESDRKTCNAGTPTSHVDNAVTLGKSGLCEP
jgi:DNA-directed RNA polymerase specialized sigma24 family protein